MGISLKKISVGVLDPGQTHSLSTLRSDLFLGIQSKDSGQDCMLQKAVSQWYLLEHPLHVILCKCRNLNRADEGVLSPFSFRI